MSDSGWQRVYGWGAPAGPAARSAPLLAAGTYVRVTECAPDSDPCVQVRTYIAKVTGHDDFGTKYRLSVRYGGWGRWLFSPGDSWAFPGEVEEISEEEATR